ncbi:hypothetical protein UFOVP1290_334 [uncultured Caudovirales phage]|uniref:Uncharacterized protein n=1 Tax=uncultured Caudovirales phage TaxID=2100421 RepID=A0A6J5RXR0_9CAUD|nr:hypothetical protein UFOVP1290_334 [uncultured Caudovirales phage]
MKVIDDCEVFDPSECYFAVGIEKDCFSTTIFITPISVWEEEGHLDDCFASQSLDYGSLPLDLSNSMEATWESKYDVEKVREAMIAKGFIENKDMYDYLFNNKD